MTEKNPKQQAIQAVAKRALVLIIVVYVVVLVFDIVFEPAYKGWLVALLTICGFLIGIGLGFTMAFKTRFSTVMKSRSDKQIIKDIHNHTPPKSGGFGLDDKE
jgi:hypothetical protein